MIAWSDNVITLVFSWASPFLSLGFNLTKIWIEAAGKAGLTHNSSLVIVFDFWVLMRVSACGPASFDLDREWSESTNWKNSFLPSLALFNLAVRSTWSGFSGVYGISKMLLIGSFVYMSYGCAANLISDLATGSISFFIGVLSMLGDLFLFSFFILILF